VKNSRHFLATNKKTTNQGNPMSELTEPQTQMQAIITDCDPKGLLSPKTIEAIAEKYLPHIAKIQELVPAAQEALAFEPTPDEAREHRLVIKNARTALNKVREALKAESLAVGRVVQSIFNQFAAEMKSLEAKLEDVEKAEERRIAEERKEKADYRRGYLLAISNDAQTYSDDFLAEMTEEQWKNFAATYEQTEKENQAKRDAEAKAAAEPAKRDADERARLAAKADEERKARLAEQEERRKAEAKLAAEQAETRRAQLAEQQRLAKEAEEKRRLSEGPDRYRIKAMLEQIEPIVRPVINDVAVGRMALNMLDDAMNALRKAAK
jgi:hypothetical protein